MHLTGQVSPARTKTRRQSHSWVQLSSTDVPADISDVILRRCYRQLFCLSTCKFSHRAERDWKSVYASPSLRIWPLIWLLSPPGTSCWRPCWSRDFRLGLRRVWGHPGWLIIRLNWHKECISLCGEASIAFQQKGHFRCHIPNIFQVWVLSACCIDRDYLLVPRLKTNVKVTAYLLVGGMGDCRIQAAESDGRFPVHKEFVH